VLCVDNRGSGQTITPHEASVTIEEMADDIAAILDHHELGAVHTVGISMGGCIALMLTLRYPQKVRSQAVAVTFAQAKSDGSRGYFILEMARALRDVPVSREVLNRVAAVILLGEAVFENADFMEAWIKAPPDPYEQTRLGYEQQVAAIRQYDIQSRLASIMTPTLVFSSPDDLLVPARFQDEIFEGIPGAEIKRYSGGHAFMALPEHAASFVQDVEVFWERHSKAI
jgi:pimeloyl-ACP methyl ester carboxylesterase